MEDKFTSYIMCLGVALLVVVQAFPINNAKATSKGNLIEATVKVEPKVRTASAILPPDKSKPYSAKKANYKFKNVLEYVNKNKERILPEIDKFSEARKELVLCLALNIYHEARGSTLDDQKAVGYVTVNRSKSEAYPTNVCEVVWQQSKNNNDKIVGQFSWTIYDANEILPKELEAWNKSQTIALEIYRQKYSNYYEEFDITDGAMHFYAPKLVKTPVWARANNISSKKQIGGHMYVKIAERL